MIHIESSVQVNWVKKKHSEKQETLTDKILLALASALSAPIASNSVYT